LGCTIPSCQETLSELAGIVVLLRCFTFGVHFIPKLQVIDIHLDESFNQLSLLADYRMVQHVSAVKITLSKCIIPDQLSWPDQVHEGKHHLHLVSPNRFD